MKRILTLLALCLMTVLAAKAQQIYATWTVATQTMTLYYDDQMEARAGTTKWWDNSILITAKRVVLDESMKYARPTSTASWFENFEQLTTIQRLDYLNTSEVTSMYAMFADCKQLSDIDLRFFDTRNVTNMGDMFLNCKSLTSLNLYYFNIYNVTKMSKMFFYCSNLTTIYCNDSWAGTSAESSSMFYGCTKLKGSNGTKCNGTSNVDASYARPDGVNSKKGYFTWTDEVYVVWDPSTTTLTFYYGKDRESRGGTPTWTSSSYMYNATKVILDQSMQNARPIRTNSWFAACQKITTIQNLNYLNTTEVKNMYRMFAGCEKLQALDLSTFYTAKVENMESMFTSCKALQSINFGNTFYTSNVENMHAMFYNCESLTSLDLSKFVTTRVQSMNSMFSGCKALRTLTLGDIFYTENVTDMSFMFNGCTNLRSVNLSAFNTPKVTTMEAMFYGCRSLTTLDVSKFKTTNLETTKQMFANCWQLKTIYCNDYWNQKSWYVAKVENMFINCEQLKGGNGTPFNSSYVDVTYARPDGGPDSATPGYFTTTDDGIEEIFATPSSGRKVLYEGQVLIERGGRIFTVQGQAVR